MIQQMGHAVLSFVHAYVCLRFDEPHPTWDHAAIARRLNCIRYATENSFVQTEVRLTKLRCHERLLTLSDCLVQAAGSVTLQLGTIKLCAARVMLTSTDKQWIAMLNYSDAIA